MKYGIIFPILGSMLLACGWVSESQMVQIITSYSAIGFLAIGIGYLFTLPAVWMKRTDGTINPIGFALCLPLHLLNWLSWQLAARLKKYPARHEIVPNLWLGRRPFAHEVKAMLVETSWATVDLTAEFQEPKALRQGKYLCLPTLDHTAPLPNHVEDALRFIAAEKPNRKVLIHCALGHGRSATIVAAWLIQNGLAKTAKEADNKLRAIRSGVRLKHSQLRLLEEMFPQK
jgi:hypothetical protein